MVTRQNRSMETKYIWNFPAYNRRWREIAWKPPKDKNTTLFWRRRRKKEKKKRHKLTWLDNPLKGKQSNASLTQIKILASFVLPWIAVQRKREGKAYFEAAMLSPKKVLFTVPNFKQLACCLHYSAHLFRLLAGTMKRQRYGDSWQPLTYVLPPSRWGRAMLSAETDESATWKRAVGILPPPTPCHFWGKR